MGYLSNTLSRLIPRARYPQRWLYCRCGSDDIESRPHDYVCRACGVVYANLASLP